MHFDMTVNLGNILTAVGLAVAFSVAHVQNVRKLQDIDTKLHAFNFGTDIRTGEKLVFVMSIIPEEQYERALAAAGQHTHDSKPLTVEPSNPDAKTN